MNYDVLENIAYLLLCTLYSGENDPNLELNRHLKITTNVNNKPTCSLGSVHSKVVCFACGMSIDPYLKLE